MDLGPEPRKVDSNRMKIGIEYDIINPPSDIPGRIDAINLINPLIPNFLEDNALTSLPDLPKLGEKVIVDGAFIDLNTGTPERAVRRVVKTKVEESIKFAKRYRASEVIFLSNFLPFLNEKQYYESWFFENAVSFWREISLCNPDMRISIANVFEFSPKTIIRVVESVNAPNLGIAFDVGHALAYSKVCLHEWYREIKPWLKTLYVHSNDRSGDQHLHLSKGAFAHDPGIEKIMAELTDETVLLKSFDKCNYADDIAILQAMNRG